MIELISKLEERKEELCNSIVENTVVEMTCSGRADGSWR